jgi:hypothetical protein
MNPRSRITLSVLSLTILSLACNLMATPPSPAPDIQPPAPTKVPDVQPVTEQPPPPPETSNLPAGLATAKDNLLTFYDLNGAQISQVELPQNTYLYRDRAHIAGKIPATGEAVPLLYFSFDNGEALLFRDGVGQIFTLQSGTSFLGLTGTPGQPLVAFSQAEYLDLALRSKIYVGSIQTLPSAAPIKVIDDPESWAIKPILVEAENGLPTKVWYTRIAYGIGGDIVFEPRKGLFVLDIATGQVDTILNDDAAPWAISPDSKWVAFSSPGSQNNSMCMKYLGIGEEVCFPALPASETRGAGNALLSPDADAQYVAWMEGEGWQMAEVPSFKATVRIGQNNGAIVADLPMNTFESTAGVGPISWAGPVAWLDNQTVIVQARGPEWDQVALLRYNVISQEISYLAPGEFVGLLYP